MLLDCRYNNYRSPRDEAINTICINSDEVDGLY